MKILAALALILAACVSNEAPTTPSVLDVRDSKFGIAGTFQENGTAIDFKLAHDDIEITSADGFQLLANHGGDTRLLETYSAVGSRFSSEAIHDLASMPELAVMRDLRGALRDRGIEIDTVLSASPAVNQILCPTLKPDAIDTMADGDVTAAN